MRRPLIALIVLVVALLIGYLVNAVRDDHSSPPPRPMGSVSSGAAGGSLSGSRPVPLLSLPPQAAQTVRLIRAGGPFPYPTNDGVVFHNNEHELPAHPDGWYHEYTVPTPGSSDRGTRRIITGKDGTYYYTGDHYETFEIVDLK